MRAGLLVEGTEVDDESVDEDERLGMASLRHAAV